MSGGYRPTYRCADSDNTASRQGLPIGLELGVNYSLVNVVIPFVIEFTGRGKRTTDFGIFWETRSLAFRTALSDETSVICQIRTSGTTSEYSVLSFDGGTWWPLFESGEQVKVVDFVGSALDSSGVFLKMMNLSPATLDSPRRDLEQFLRSTLLRRIETAQRTERLRAAETLADKTLFCNGLVYLKGGLPVFFAVNDGEPGDQTLVFEVGSAEPEIEAIARYLPGVKPHLKRSAACNSLVYGVEEIAVAMQRHREHGVRTILEARVDTKMKVISSQSAAEFCARELVNRAIRTMTVRNLSEISALSGVLYLRNQAIEALSPSILLEVIHAMITLCPESEFEQRYGIKYEGALETRSRLSAINPRIELSESDIDILAEVGDQSLRRDGASIRSASMQIPCR